MSQSLISRSPDLKRLEDEGFEIEVRAGYLILKNIPYATKANEVQLGSLVSVLDLAGNKTAKPRSHEVMFNGEMPCDKNGRELVEIQHSSQRQDLGDGITVNHSFSSKPKEGYTDYHHKMTTYVSIIFTPARSIDPNTSPRPFATFEAENQGSVFEYPVAATSRARIGKISEKLKEHSVAIIGLGGTGSYILDFVAKTPVQEIHLFDGDKFGNHNAFRSPGAPSIDTLNGAPMKAEYFRDVYLKMRRNVFAKGFSDESNVECLRETDFVFVAVDKGSTRKLLVERLSEFGVPFIDVGMGVRQVGNSLGGQLRVTISTDQSRDLAFTTLTEFSDNDEDEYSTNIQIVELNAMAAALAVIQWKRFLGFYVDLREEISSVFVIDGNKILSRGLCE